MARASARRFMADQDGMLAIGAAVAALAEIHCRRRGFTRGSITECVSVITGLFT
jgi:hypothetical protein